jgi:hypothetical protein
VLVIGLLSDNAEGVGYLKPRVASTLGSNVEKRTTLKMFDPEELLQSSKET